MDFALRQQERSLFARGPMVLFQWRDLDAWPVDFVSANVEKVLRFSVDEFVACGFKGLLDPRDVDRVRLEIQTKSQELAQEFEHEPFRIVGKENEPIWLLAHTAIFRDDSGQISHYLSYVLDVSDRRKAELDLKDSKARYHQVFETNTAVKLIIDPSDGRIVEANQSAVRFYGHTLEVLTQMKITDINMLSREEVALEMERAKSEERLFFNFKHRLQSGEVRDVEVYSGPVKSTEGLLLFSIIYDVTERLQAEQSLLASHQKLANTLAELEHTQALMVQRERLAAVGQLTTGIAHDFNNILTGILGFAELLHSAPETPSQNKEDLKSIIQSGERGALLIQQLLDFSRRSTQHYQLLNCNAFLGKFTSFLTRTIPANIRVVYELNDDDSDGEFWLRADPNQIHQVLTNLALNARDVMPKGGTFKLALSRVFLEEHLDCVICSEKLYGTWLRLDISDTGAGIDEEVLPRIFEPFFTTKSVGRGSGLGLSQVAGIISQHQGHIQVESTPHKGTTFRCFLRPTNDREFTSIKHVDDQLIYGNGETILLVEDDPTVNAVIRFMLKNLGYKVLNATNGEEALVLFEAHQSEIALTLSDVMMPGLSGMELFRILNERAPEDKMILMSGYPLSQEDAEELERGDVDWVQKPISLLVLSQLLHKNIDTLNS